MPRSVKIPSASGEGNLSGKVALITGGSSGLGFATAVELAKRECRVVITSRKLERAEVAAEKICEAARVPTRRLDALELELSNLNGLKKFVKSYKEIQNRMDFLILNAGGINNGFKTDDDFDIVYFERMLSVHALTCLFWDMLEKSGTGERPSRVVLTCGLAITWTSLTSNNIYNWLVNTADEEIEGKTPCQIAPHKVGGIAGLRAPSTAAQCWVLAMGARAGMGSNVLFTMTHPGFCPYTDGLKNMGYPSFVTALMQNLTRLIFSTHSQEQGCLSNVAACVIPELSQGTFFGPVNTYSGPPGIIELRKQKSVDGKKWKAISGPAGVLIGELAIKEATEKSRLSIPLEAPEYALILPVDDEAGSKNLYSYLWKFVMLGGFAAALAVVRQKLRTPESPEAEPKPKKFSLF